jgi:hypothetical protein
MEKTAKKSPVDWSHYFEEAVILKKRSFIVANFVPANGARNVFKEDEKELRELAGKYGYAVSVNKHHALFLNKNFVNPYLKS